MTSSTPWWAPLLFTFAGGLLTLAVSWLKEHTQRRDDRMRRWDDKKRELYADFVRACRNLHDVPVWAADRTETAPSTREPMATIVRVGEDVWLSAPNAVTLAANVAAEAAEQLMRVIGDLRAATIRGAHGAMDETASKAHEQARESLNNAITDFARAARQDLGIVADVIPSRRHAAAPHWQA